MSRITQVLEILGLFTLIAGRDCLAQVHSPPSSAVAEIENGGGIVEFAGAQDDRHVVGLTLRGPTVTDKALAIVARLGDLRDLRLESTAVTDAGLIHLAKLTKIRSLDLSGTRVRGPGLVRIQGLLNLERLVLPEITLDPNLAGRLGVFQRLQELYLGHCRVSDASIGKLTALKGLRSLTFFFCTGFSENSFQQIGQFGDLEYLELSGTKDLTNGMKRLAALPRLRRLILDGVATDAMLKNIGTLSNLRELSVSLSEVSDAGIRHLASLKNLEVLDLDGTKITDSGLTHLRALTRLRDLSLTDTAVTDKGLPNLEALVELRMLALPGAKVTEEGVAKLRRALPRCVITRRSLYSGLGGIVSEAPWAIPAQEARRLQSPRPGNRRRESE